MTDPLTPAAAPAGTPYIFSNTSYNSQISYSISLSNSTSNLFQTNSQQPTPSYYQNVYGYSQMNNQFTPSYQNLYNYSQTIIPSNPNQNPISNLNLDSSIQINNPVNYFSLNGSAGFLLNDTNDPNSIMNKQLADGTNVSFFNDGKGNVYRVNDDNLIINENGEPLTVNGNYIGIPRFGYEICELDKDLNYQKEAQNLSKNKNIENYKVSPYDLIMDDKEKREQFLRDISDFCKDDSFQSTVEELKNQYKGFEEEINNLDSKIYTIRNKKYITEKEKATLADAEREKEELEQEKELLEKSNIMEAIESINNFKESISNNFKEINDIYSYSNTLSEKERDEVRKEMNREVIELHKHMMELRDGSIKIGESIDKIDGLNYQDASQKKIIDLYASTINCQTNIIKERIKVVDEKQKINKEQLDFWKDQFHDVKSINELASKKRKDNLNEWRKSVNDINAKISEKQKNLEKNYKDYTKDNSKLNTVSNNIKATTDSFNKPEFTNLTKGVGTAENNYKNNKKTLDWDEVKDIESFINFIKNKFFDDYDKAKEYYDHNEKIINNNFINKNGFDKIVETAKYIKNGEKVKEGNTAEPPAEQAKDSLKYEMEKYLLSNEGVDIKTAKEMTKFAEFDKQPLKQYAKNLETIYTKKNKIHEEGNTPLTLEKIDEALKQGVEENSIGLKRRFITKKTKESATSINNLIMGAIVKECGDRDFNNLPDEERAEILKNALTKFEIGDGVATNSLLASDSRASALVMQGLKNINKLAEKAARDEETLKRCDEEIKKQIGSANNVINEKAARSASKYYKNKIKEVEKEEISITDKIVKKGELENKSREFKEKEGNLKKQGNRVNNFLKPFIETVDKDKMKRKNVTTEYLKSKNTAIRALDFDKIKKELGDKGNKSLKHQLEVNREKQKEKKQQNSGRSFNP